MPSTPGLNFYQPRQWFSISSLTAFHRCPRKFFYGSGCRLTKGEHPALTYGTAIHKGVPELLNGEEATKLSRAIAGFSSCWDEALADDKRNSARAALLLGAFHSYVRNWDYELIKPPSCEGLKVGEKNSDWEFPFAIKTEAQLPLVGKIDGIARHKRSGELWVLEYKTTSELSTRFLTAFTLNPQTILYPGVLRSLGMDVKGTIILGLLVSKTRTEVLMNQIHVTDYHVSEALAWANITALQIQACEKRGEFYKDFSGCHPYSMFGSPGYNCEFLELCQIPDWTALKPMYKIREEKPFELSGPSQE